MKGYSFPLIFRLFVSLATLGCASQGARAVEPDGSSFLLDFLVGEYALVGQNPDSTKPYSGRARVSRSGERLILTRWTDGIESNAVGGIEVPHPPGEGEVVRFRWTEREPRLMTCLVHGDLDNYARLTCLWGPEGRSVEQPGVEALFPVTAWPDDAPSRAGWGGRGDQE